MIELVFIVVSALMLIASSVLCAVTVHKARKWQASITDYHDLYRDNLRLKLELAAGRGEVRF